VDDVDHVLALERDKSAILDGVERDAGREAARGEHFGDNPRPPVEDREIVLRLLGTPTRELRECLGWELRGDDVARGELRREDSGLSSGSAERSVHADRRLVAALWADQKRGVVAGRDATRCQQGLAALIVSDAGVS